jgi:hypothetical protein
LIRGLLLVLATLLATSAHAAHPGRASAGIGWRLAPQNHFYGKATEAGHPPTQISPGGPVINGTFSYNVSDWAAVAVDLFASGERLHLEGWEPINLFAYGATVGARFFFLEEVLHPDLGFHASIALGPTLVFATSGSFASIEVFTQSYAAGAGALWRISDDLGLGAEYRFSLVRGLIPDIGGVNAGGSQVTVSLTWFFAAESSFTRGQP